MSNICLAGNGWGAISAYHSLIKNFDKMSIVTDDNDLISLVRERDTILSDFGSCEFDLIICAGYKPLLSKEFVDSNRVINIHYSLLPKYRGMHSTVWAILNGESSMGLTVHEMNEFVDDGDIIHQYEFEYNDETATEVINICNTYIEKNLNVIVDDYINDRVNPESQDKSKASWVCKRNFNDCELDFSWDLEFIYRFFKALSFPYPIPFFYRGESRLTIMNHKLVKCDVNMTFGRVVNIDSEGVWIQVKGGYLVVSALNDHEGNNVDLSSFKIGERL